MKRFLALTLALALTTAVSAQNDSRVDVLNSSSGNTIDIDQVGSMNTVGMAATPESGVYLLSGDDNDVDIDQAGVHNDAFIQLGGPVLQSSNTNTIKIDQTSGTSGNSARVRMINLSDKNDVDIRQDGDLNVARARFHHDSDQNTLEVDQDGMDNRVDALPNNSSSKNDFQVDQDGSGHRARITMEDSDRNGDGAGDLGKFSVKQSGSDHTASMYLDGAFMNGFDIDQAGMGHSIDVDGDWTTSDGLIVTGDRNYTRVDQSGVGGHSYTQTIAGDSNTLTVTQTD